MLANKDGEVQGRTAGIDATTRYAIRDDDVVPFRHFVPTSSSWLNLVERWSTDLTGRRLRRRVFTSVGALVEALTAWATSWNQDPKPFVWHKEAEEIIEKVRRGRAALNQVKSATRD